MTSIDSFIAVMAVVESDIKLNQVRSIRIIRIDRRDDT